MKEKYFLFLYIFFILSCVSSKEKKAGDKILNAQDLFPFGRTAITNQGLELISSASHFTISFTGTKCRIFAGLSEWQDHNYLQYELDGHGLFQKRIRIKKGDQQPITITTGKEGRHTVIIYKATEAHSGPIYIRKIEGKNIKAIKPTAAPVIEFIGNSITCGAAADPSDVPCGKGEYHDQHNAAMAYGPRIARALRTNFLLSSVSGIGIYRNWNSNDPAMPEVYAKTDFQKESNRFWEFHLYQPKIVSIALGTNDLSTGDGKNPRLPFDSAIFVSNYIRFVQLVKSKYPAAQIALLSSPMISGERRTLLQNCLLAVKENIDQLFATEKPLAIHFLKPMKARGCTGHPNVEDHQIIAEELLPFFRKLLQ